MSISKWNEASLNEVYRTKFQSYVENGQSYTTLILSNGSNSYSSFKDCYNKVLLQKDSKTYTLSSFTQDLIEAFEDVFNCNGICRSGQFYFAKTLDSGPPGKTCKRSLKNALQNVAINTGITLVATFVITLVTFILSFWQCCKKVDKSFDGNQYKKGRKNNRGNNLTGEFSYGLGGTQTVATQPSLNTSTPGGYGSLNTSHMTNQSVIIQGVPDMSLVIEPYEKEEKLKQIKPPTKHKR
eukprot:403374645